MFILPKNHRKCLRFLCFCHFVIFRVQNELTRHWPRLPDSIKGFVRVIPKGDTQGLDFFCWSSWPRASNVLNLFFYFVFCSQLCILYLLYFPSRVAFKMTSIWFQCFIENISSETINKTMMSGMTLYTIYGKLFILYNNVRNLRCPGRKMVLGIYVNLLKSLRLKSMFVLTLSLWTAANFLSVKELKN